MEASQGEQSNAPTQSRSWSCNTCQMVFQDGQAQRQHMKEPWHLYNLKRRIASMEPLSLDTFISRVQPKPEAVDEAEKVSSEEESSDLTDQDIDSPHQCLFCQHESPEESDSDLEAILDHMLTTHGLLIPHQESISDLPSFLGYLATQIRVWHDCLYCGITRDSTSAIRSHMRDRGHCMLNLDREPELLDFWETTAASHEDKESTRSKLKTATVEAHLSSGKVIASRHHPSKRVETARKREMRLALLAEANASSRTESPKPRAANNNNRQLARREEMSIAGIDPQRRQALMVAEKRSQKQEEVATRASEWAYAKKANKQKYDQNHGPLSWAKGGLHQLLPR